MPCVPLPCSWAVRSSSRLRPSPAARYVAIELAGSANGAAALRATWLWDYLRALSVRMVAE